MKSLERIARFVPFLALCTTRINEKLRKDCNICSILGSLVHR
jgi:hypothetical protein